MEDGRGSGIGTERGVGDEGLEDEELDVRARGVDEGQHVLVPGVRVLQLLLPLRVLQQRQRMEDQPRSAVAEDLDLLLRGQELRAEKRAGCLQRRREVCHALMQLGATPCGDGGSGFHQVPCGLLVHDIVLPFESRHRRQRADDSGEAREHGVAIPARAFPRVFRTVERHLRGVSFQRGGDGVTVREGAVVAFSLPGDDVSVDGCAGLGCEDEGVGLGHEGEDAVVLRFVGYDGEFLRAVYGDADALFADDGVARCDDDGLGELKGHGVDDAVAGVD